VIMAQGFGHLLGTPNSTAVEVHQVSIRHRMGEDHTAPPPIPCGMRPGTRRRIAHAQLLRQFEGNATLLQVRFAAAAREGSLERSELLGEVGACWGGRTWCWWRSHPLPACCHWLRGKPRWRLAAVWSALPTGWWPLYGRLPLLLLAPLGTCRLHIAPGPTGKAHRAAAVHSHPQAALAVRAVEGTQDGEHIAAFAHDGLGNGEISTN
jgi:hypothetical protein